MLGWGKKGETDLEIERDGGGDESTFRVPHRLFHPFGSHLLEKSKCIFRGMSFSLGKGKGGREEKRNL